MEPPPHHVYFHVDVLMFQTRYYILLVKASRGHKRKFDASGQEVEPNFSQTTKVSTGYLNSSYSKMVKLMIIIIMIIMIIIILIIIIIIIIIRIIKKEKRRKKRKKIIIICGD